MYTAELIYGIRTAFVDEELSKEYGLVFVPNQFIRVPERLVLHLPRTERSQTVSLCDWWNPDWDVRLHKYAADAGMIDYDIGWHVYVPQTEAETTTKNSTKPTIASFDFEKAVEDSISDRKVCSCTSPCFGFRCKPNKFFSVGTETGRVSSSKSNVSEPPRSGKWKEAINRFFDTREDPVSGKVVVREDVTSTTQGGGSIQQRGDRWFIMNWRANDLELIKPLEIRVTTHRLLKPTYLVKCGRFSEASNSRNPRALVTALAGIMFGRYAELLEPCKDDNELDVADRKFLSSKIRETSVEGVAISATTKQRAEEIDSFCHNLINQHAKPATKPAWTYPLIVKQTVQASEEDRLIAEIKANLEKPLGS